MDKTKFVVNPQLDSEGFVMADARCRGCGPDEMCPRSGHCERYDSPLRFIGGDFGPLEARMLAHMADLMLANAHLDGLSVTGRTVNPPGWQEVYGVKLPPITWACTCGSVGGEKRCTCANA